MDSGIGILGVGLYLPPIVRTNDEWPRELVARWTAGRRAPPPTTAPSPGAAHVRAALVEQAADPFQGAVQRHVMPDGMTVLDLAEHAARQAIERAGVAASDVDLLLTNMVMPDVLLANPATQVHRRLGLPRRCFAMETEAAAYSFVMQVALAEAMIASGRARLAVLVQACGASRLIDLTEPTSVLFGDGATAVVVGRVSAGRGVLGSVHFTDGRYGDTLVASVPGGTWASPGRGMIHVADPAKMTALFLETADVCKESIDAVLAATGHAARDIGFFAMYQGTPWLRGVVQRHVGLDHARSIETFARTGYLFSAVLPAGLFYAEQEGLLSAGDLVLMTGGGTGMTFGSTVLRWGT